MSNGRIERTEGIPTRTTAPSHWGEYAVGMATEVLFVICLTGVGLLLAVIASVVWL